MNTSASPHRRARLLAGALLVLAGLYLATWPARSRIARETARIERDTALKNEAMARIRELERQAEAAARRIQANPRDVQARLERASALGQLRRYPEAAREIRQAQALEPNSAEPCVALGEISDASGLPDVAVQEYRKALERNPRHARALSLLAYKYVAFGWNKDAADLLSRAIKELPDDPRLHINLGLVYFQNGDYAAAEKELLAARSLAPEDSTVLGPLAQVYRQSQRYPEALRVLDEALRHSPNAPALHVEKARVYLELQKPAEAIRAANQAAALDASILEPVYIRGVAEKMRGNVEAAIAELEKVRQKEPRLEQTLLHLGTLYTQKGQSEKGRQLIAQFDEIRTVSDTLARLTLAVAHKPDDPDAHLELGEKYLEGGSLARAIVELKRSLELRPGHAPALRLLHAAFTRANRLSEARAVEQALIRKP